MTQRPKIIYHIKAALLCDNAIYDLELREQALTLTDYELTNCGLLSPSCELKYIIKANKRILEYIDSLKGKQRLVTPIQISKELGLSKEFIEDMLIAHGFIEES